MRETGELSSMATISRLSDPKAGPDRVPAAIAVSDRAESMEMLSQLATVPVWRSSVGGSTQRATPGHVGGGARVATGRGGPISVKRTGATVALADGTRITFGAVEVDPTPALEPA